MIEQQKKWNLHNPILYAVVIAIGMFLGYKMKGTLLHADAIGTSSGNVDEIMNLVKERYVDSVGTDSVEAKAIDNLLSQLDPHSVYIPPSDLKSVDEDMDGEFEGIGIEYFVKKDTLMVTSVIAGGPSAEAGILTGDKFISVNDSIIAGKKLNTELLIKHLRGRSGTKANIKLMRNHKLIPNIAITRGKVPMYSIDASYMLSPTIGYIKINRFAATTYNEFMKAMQALQKAGMKKLMIDVRDNPGGYLETAVQIIDELIAGNKKIVYTRGRIKANETYSASKTGLFETGKVVVLVDEGSASAAEILSGALQDYDRATIIGRRTFGKGLVQEQYPLSNGGALRLTIARYYIPSGRCIQKDYSHGIENYQDDVMNRFKKGELVSQDSVIFKDTTVYKTMAGRRVYGGGGIMPDVFVPIINAKYNAQLSDILGSGFISEIANAYYADNKDALNKYATPADLNKYANASTAMIQKLIQKCKEDGIATNSLSNIADKNLITTRLMAQLAKAKFGNAAQYQIYNANDDMIKVALKEIEK
jgi:carboxyl-terminal processing protease